MRRRDQERLDDIDDIDDIDDAMLAIASHLQRGDLDDGLIFDAIRVRLIEIGEAVKGMTQVLLAQEPAIAWQDVAGMRDRLTHHYFDTSHGIVRATIFHS